MPICRSLRYASLGSALKHPDTRPIPHITHRRYIWHIQRNYTRYGILPSS